MLMKCFFTHGCIKKKEQEGSGNCMGRIFHLAHSICTKAGSGFMSAAAKWGVQEGKWEGARLSQGSSFQHHTSHARG